MKAPMVNRIAAHFLPIIAQAGGVTAVAILGFLYGRIGIFDVGVRLGIAVIASFAAAYAAGALIGTIFLGILLHEPFRRIQGAPFKIGDQVMILRGSRKGKVTEVYEIWYPRTQVRVRLTEDEAISVADVYSDYDLMKIENEPNKAMQPTPVAVTPCAVARVAPSTSVADL